MDLVRDVYEQAAQAAAKGNVTVLHTGVCLPLYPPSNKRSRAKAHLAQPGHDIMGRNVSIRMTPGRTAHSSCNTPHQLCWHFIACPSGDHVAPSPLPPRSLMGKLPFFPPSLLPLERDGNVSTHLDAVLPVPD